MRRTIDFSSEYVNNTTQNSLHGADSGKELQTDTKLLSQKGISQGLHNWIFWTLYKDPVTLQTKCVV